MEEAILVVASIKVALRQGGSPDSLDRFTRPGAISLLLAGLSRAANHRPPRTIWLLLVRRRVVLPLAHVDKDFCLHGRQVFPPANTLPDGLGILVALL